MLMHYCIVRADLPLGVLAAMLIHAAGESSPGGLPSGTHAVALAAEDEDHLLKIERRLVFSRIDHTAIREPSAPYNGALMAIGLPPMSKALQPGPLKRLPLLGTG